MAHAQPLPPLAERTLPEMRAPLVEAMLAHVPFDGWTTTSLDRAADDLGLPRDVARLAFPEGAGQMVACWSRLADERVAALRDDPDFAARKVREKVTEAIRRRLMEAEGHRDALRRALAVLARPSLAPLAARLGWETADAIWHAAGDAATDWNHYSKRAIAMGIYSATLAVWLDDESEDAADTWAFLDRRIAGVMAFERWKARLRPSGSPAAPGFSPLRFLGRLRYPAR